MILFIDCYDSFSYNLIRLIESATAQEVVVCHNDQLTATQLKLYLPFLDAIVLGPGPGDPHIKGDSGVVEDVWSALEENPVPTFGICFGYQSMVLHHGGEVKRMDPPHHGLVSVITQTENSRLFAELPRSFNAVRYHSLCASFDEKGNGHLRSIAVSAEDNIEMAVEHRSLPFYAVQFHPESVLSEYGELLFKNFWTVAREYNASRKLEEGRIPRANTVTHCPLMPRDLASNQLADIVIKPIGNSDWTTVASKLDDFVLLKSASHPGDWSIFGVLENGVTPHIRSKAGTVFTGKLHSTPTKVEDKNIWQYTSEFMAPKMLNSQAVSNGAGVPFLGGIVGYVSYEGGCQYSLNNGEPLESGLNSDVSFVFVDKSIQIHESTSQTYAVGPASWVQSVTALFERNSSDSSRTPANDIVASEVSSLSRDQYNDLIEKCFDKLKAGDSYELCLTTSTQVKFAAEVRPWDIFRQLVAKNPAPYCTFMDFDDTLLASSPERFLAWDKKRCEFRPIKGTVRKGKDMTIEKATEILKTPKEQAENLMIVDLIRHDLSQLTKDVSVTELMTVEEYHSVYQLVTGIEGKFHGEYSGIDVLAQSLPPGSMTGAPKKRSVEILRDLEKKPRGLYSGVNGYWGIDDRSDWSVIIRSLFRSKANNTSENTWTLGAGGAVTVLSTTEGEFEEMHTKLNTVLKAFDTHS